MKTLLIGTLFQLGGLYNSQSTRLDVLEKLNTIEVCKSTANYITQNYISTSKSRVAGELKCIVIDEVTGEEINKLRVFKK